jgi:hypothetical protein
MPGLPTLVPRRYEILRSCLTELQRAGIVVDCPALLTYAGVKRQALQLPGSEAPGDMLPDPGHELSRCAELPGAWPNPRRMAGVLPASRACLPPCASAAP